MWQNFKPKRIVLYKRYAFWTAVSIVALFVSTPQAFLHWIIPGNEDQAVVTDEVFSVAVYLSGKIFHAATCFAIRWIDLPSESKNNVWLLLGGTTYLIFIIIILPTFSVESVFLVLRNFIIGNDETSAYAKNGFRESLNCLYKANGSLIFMKYLISAAMAGTAVELLRWFDLLYLLFLMITSTTWAEVKIQINQYAKTYVWFGEYYSFDLLNLTMTIALSTTTPLILPIGWAYFMMKHMAASYTLRNAYRSTKISVDFHKSVVSYVVGSTVLCQVYTAFFVNLNTDRGSYVASTSGFLTILYGALWLVQVDSSWRWPFPVFPFKYQKVAVKDKVTRKMVYKPWYLRPPLWPKMKGNNKGPPSQNKTDSSRKHKIL